MPKYKLREGRRHHGPGGVLLAPGSVVEMSEERFTGANLKDRFDLVGDSTELVNVPGTPIPVVDFSAGEATVDVATVPSDSEPPNWNRIATYPASEVIQMAESLSNIEDLRALVAAERRARARSSVIKTINRRISDLEEP